mmetsp:Transcript_16197/g.22623  ORF Transcript_16197/g.22623 Transcript_16197/m.22623 type:complete len:260 (-) Transcript_16197:468-1247(-)|eukprot:jgi/Bigna1/145418/aug1.99_g20126
MQRRKNERGGIQQRNHPSNILMRTLAIIRASEVYSRGEDVKLLKKSEDLIFSLQSCDIEVSVNNIGQTTLHYLAAIQGQSYATLLQKACRKNPEYVSHVSKDKETPLHEAFRANNLQAVKILLDNNASCLSIDLDGRSPLMIASTWLKSPVARDLNIRKEMVSLLTYHSILEGLDFEQKDLHGQSMKDLILTHPQMLANCVHKGSKTFKCWLNHVRQYLLPYFITENIEMIQEFTIGSFMLQLINSEEKELFHLLSFFK